MEAKQDKEPFNVPEEMENLAEILLTALSNRREYGALVRVGEHLHRLRMCSEATNHTSRREDLSWHLSWALESLAHGNRGEAESSIGEYLQIVESIDDESLDTWTVKDYAARGKEVDDCLRQSTEESRHRAATIIGSTLRKLTLAKSML